MSDDDYIETSHTGGVTNREKSTSSTTPSSKPTNYLASQRNDWPAQLRASGHTVVDIEPPTDTGRYTVNFIPKRGGAVQTCVEMREIPNEPCPACGTFLDGDGRCRACWGDVMGLCDVCGGFLEHGVSADDPNYCPTCTSKVIPTSSD
jgi:hypothetical protein